MRLCAAIVMVLVASGMTFPVEENGQNPEEMAGEFEGDIILSENQKTKHGTTNIKNYWPEATMFYTISPTFGEAEKKLILKAIDSFHTRTCLRIVERTDEENYVHFVPSDGGCSSKIGMQGGEQPLKLGKKCFTETAGTIMHEIMHAFGFWHQQGAANRDEYVTINVENIIPKKLGNFKKYPKSSDFGVGYDYGSILHYPRRSFSINGKDTITPKDPNAVIGQRVAMSDKDILKLQKMYKCNKQEIEEYDF